MNGVLQMLFGSAITLQFIVVFSHDLIDIPGWTNGSQVKALIGERKLWLVTFINGIFPGAAAALAIYFWSRPVPSFVSHYWVLYCAVTVGSAIGMWYLPYFRGASEEQKRNYLQMYAGTRHILPARGDNPRPNLLHVCFHVLFLITFGLATILWLRP